MKQIELANIIESILNEKKGKDIEVINVEGKTILAEYFVIVTGTSAPHVRSLSEEIQFKLKTQYDIDPEHVEGTDSKKWILLDYDGVIVHIFQQEERTFYSLEKLWKTRPSDV